MTSALVVTHTESEGPGHLASWLPEAGLELDIVAPWRGDALPDRVTNHAALVIMGGPQQAYDDTSAPWLRATKDLIRRAVADGVPVLGICLGAQLLAEATGGRVAAGDRGPEVGAQLVGKRDLASKDPLFWDLPMSPVVVQWHWDVVTELPPGAILLANSTTYPNQAFRVGDLAWGIQFHVETPPEMVQRWVEQDASELLERGIDPERVLTRTLAELDEVADIWGEVLRRFAVLALGR